MTRQVLDISTSTIIRVVFVLFGIWFIVAIWKILASIFLAIVIASALEPGVQGLLKIKIPRLISVIIVYIVAVFAIFAVFYAVFPALVNEIRQLSTDLPERYLDIVSSTEQFFGRGPVDINVKGQFGNFLNNIQQSIPAEASNIFAFLSNLFGGIMSLSLVLIVSFYLMLKKDGIEDFFKSFIPQAHQNYALDLWKRIQKKLGRWFQGQLLLGIFVGILMFLALWLMGAKYALTIAILAGALEIIPVIGPIITGVIAFLLIFLQSPMLAVVAIIAYFFIEQIQQYIFMPHVLSRTIGLNPIVIIVALLIGAKLLGFWGIILAVPLTVAVSEFVRDFRK